MTTGSHASNPARRSLLKGAALLAAGSATAILPSAAQGARSGRPAATGAKDAVQAGAGRAIAQTRSGKVAGYVRDGVFAFKGLPYADTTAGANRFLPPQPPKPWDGVRSSRSFGLVAPQDKGTGRLNDEEAFLFQWNDSVEGEDCLRVNVWTPGIADGGKRPVMVWLHGGGFAAGSGNDLPAFDGHNLAQRGDVVVVTLNHRLNVLGFLDLSAYDARYRHSGNVSMLDIVAALEWVRDNIAAFGGDPGCVTIFGQSGGGAKVTSLMGMPAAKGLFHRAIVQSGSFRVSNTQEKSRRLAALMLEELGVAPGDLGALQTIPYARLRKASEDVLARVNTPSGPGFDPRRTSGNLAFAPVLDGDVLPTSPFGPDAPAISANVPMMMGTTLNEFTTGINHPEYEAMTLDEVRARVSAAFPGKGEAVFAAFHKRTPDVKPFDLWSRIMSARVRMGAVEQAASKAAQGAAPAYLYWFTWQTAVLDGRPRAFHCAEIPFVFNNSDVCENMTGGGPRAAALGATLSDAWVAFARSGNPNHAGMPLWKPYSAQEQSTMLLDDRCSLASAIDAEELATIA